MKAIGLLVRAAARAAVATSFAAIVAAQDAGSTRPASSPTKADSRPVEADPAVLFRPVVRRRRDGLAPWTWPPAETFAARADAAALRDRPLWTARANLRGIEAVRPDGYDVVIENGFDREGPEISRIVVARASAGLGPDLGERMTKARGVPLTAQRPTSDLHVLFLDSSAATDEVVCDRLVAQGMRSPRGPHAALFGYAAALLADSPGDPQLPVGRYSWDVDPAAAAANFALEAAQAGALGRFLRLRLWTVGDRLDLRGYVPPFDDSAITTACGDLDSAPIDVAAFLAGLVLQFDGGPPRAIEIGPEGLGRAVVDAGVAATLKPWLVATAADERVDGHNRLRAAQTLFFVYAHEPGRAPLASGSARTRDVGHVRAKMRGLRLSRPAKIWIGLPD